MSECLDETRLDAALRGEGSTDERTHLAACEHCRTALADFAKDAALLAELASSERAQPIDSKPQVAGYEIGAAIHRGAQATVYHALELESGRVVALKLLARRRRVGLRERRRFEREIELVRRLDHAGIVPILASGVADGLPWFAMELVDGVTLDRELGAHARPVRAVIELFVEIAAAVAHAHRRGVIHRDLKPSNILVDSSGRPRVLDFGVAFASGSADEPARVTKTGEFLGTIAYAAPEQLRGAAHDLDTRTDVYSIGAVLFEALTGRLADDRSGSLGQIVERAANGAPRRASFFAPNVDGELDLILAKCLAVEPAERYDSADALERELRRWLAGEPLEARRASLAYVLCRRLVRHRRVIAPVAAALAIVAFFAIGWWREHARADAQHEQADLVRSAVRDLLGAAAPDRMGGDARLIDVYERIAQDLDHALDRAPDVQAEVEFTIGDTYRRLLRAAEAEPHLRRALERIRGVDDGRGLEIARVENALALVLAAQNRPEAIAVANSALARRENALDRRDPAIAESCRTLAIALLGQFQVAEAERARALLDRALEISRAALGADHPDVAESEFRRAQQGDLTSERTEHLFAHATATFAERAGDDPRTIECLNAHAAFLQREQHFDEALTVLDRSAALTQKLFGEQLATDMIRRFARLAYARGDFENSELLSRRAVACELCHWADKRADERQELVALAQRVERPGSPADAPPFATAFAELRRIEGDGRFELAEWMNGLALVLNRLGRGVEVEALMRQALEIHCRAMGADCPVRQRSIELVSNELVDQGRGAEAVPLLEESLATFERRGAKDGDASTRTRELLAKARAQGATAR